ncbi:hypothetical protein SOVF_107280, partial [Spinacia oleracea]
ADRRFKTTCTVANRCLFALDQTTSMQLNVKSVDITLSFGLVFIFP